MRGSRSGASRKGRQSRFFSDTDFADTTPGSPFLPPSTGPPNGYTGRRRGRGRQGATPSSRCGVAALVELREPEPSFAIQQGPLAKPSIQVLQPLWAECGGPDPPAMFHFRGSPRRRCAHARPSTARRRPGTPGTVCFHWRLGGCVTPRVLTGSVSGRHRSGGPSFTESSRARRTALSIARPPGASSRTCSRPGFPVQSPRRRDGIARRAS